MQRQIFTPDHDTFRDSVRRFMQTEVAPHADEWNERRIVDREAFRKAGECGLLLMWAPPELGGAGIEDFRYEQIILEEQARCGEPGFFMTLHSRLVGPYIGRLGTPEQRRRFLPPSVRGDCILGIAMTEPGAGSDLAAIETRAECRGDHWVLSGSKTFISNGINGDLFVVAARTILERPHAIGLFLVERGMARFSRGRNLKKIGLHAQDTAELFFDEVEVPASHVLGDPHKGFYALMQFLVEERLISACGALAAAQTAFDLTLDYVGARRVFGRTLGTLQNTRFKLAELRTLLDAAQAFVDQCVLAHTENQLTAELAAEVKLFTSEVEQRVIDECLQLHGGIGYMAESRIGRLYGNARVSRIYAGSSEIMKEIIGRGLGLDERKQA